MFGIKSKRSQVKFIISALCVVCFFIYANVTAETAHNAEVTVLQDKELLPEIVKDINSASNSIYIAVYMFKNYDNIKNGAGMLKSSLIKAAKKGVKVYVAMDFSGDGGFLDKANKKTGKELRKHNIIVIYDSPDVRMHSKCAVIDEKISYIGSHNYTNSALKYNRELTVRVVSPEVAKDTIGHIKTIK